MSETKISTKDMLNVYFFHQDKEAPVVVVGIHEFARKCPFGDDVPDAKNMSISIDDPEVHLYLSLPRDAARTLVEKMQLQLKDMLDPHEL